MSGKQQQCSDQHQLPVWENHGKTQQQHREMSRRKVCGWVCGGGTLSPPLTLLILSSEWCRFQAFMLLRDYTVRCHSAVLSFTVGAADHKSFPLSLFIQWYCGSNMLGMNQRWCNIFQACFDSYLNQLNWLLFLWNSYLTADSVGGNNAGLTLTCSVVLLLRAQSAVLGGRSVVWH